MKWRWSRTIAAVLPYADPLAPPASMRAGLLARTASGLPPATSGPAVIIVSADDTVQQMSAGAEERLADLVERLALGGVEHAGQHRPPGIGHLEDLVYQGGELVVLGP